MKTYISIALIVLLSIATLTFLHDPILHGAVAQLNDWEVVDYEKGLLTGYTNVSMTQEQYENTPLSQIWLFYMAPALILFFGAALVILIEPNRMIGVVGIILMFLNLASLCPERLLATSDASQARDVLIAHGWEPVTAIFLHWGIFIAALLTLAFVFHAMLEDNQADSERRIKEVVK